MTKEELLEDVRIGDTVKLFTESNEVVEGEVSDFGESGLKITITNSSRSKRIMYGRILEYEIIDLDEGGSTEDKTEKSIAFDRKSIFGETGTTIDLEEVKAAWEKKLNPEQKNEHVRISNMLDYAQKVHEFSLDSDRVKRAVMEYRKLAETDKVMYVFLALIYHEFNDIGNALEYYHKAGAYDVEFQLSVRYGYEEDLFEKAVLAVSHNSEKEAIIKWLCEYAVKNNDFAVISYLSEHCSALLGKVLLYWYMDKPEIQRIPEKNDLFSDINTEYLKNILAGNPAKKDARLEAILAEAKEPVIAKDAEVHIHQKTVYKGRISYYNKNGGNGMIRSDDGGTIYFYIKQVKDLELQRILATEADYKRKVSYTKGINFRGGTRGR
jgi:hypothetical protein